MPRLHPNLQPYNPAADGTFDSVKAAHLLNRAGFGGRADEISKVIKLGPIKAVDWLLDFPDAPAEEQSKTDVPDLSEVEGYPRTFAERRKLFNGKSPDERQMLQQKLNMVNRQAVGATVNWWLKRMVDGPYPLQEKLSLFWHGHFTTSARDERSAWLMWQQNELLRRQGAGNFKEFVRQVSRDPAMLDYLNNSQNRKAHPNENYARELMELFTLGIGNYTEKDIKEAARAFTGWAHDGDAYIYRSFDHDKGAKAFFGRTGNFDGDDVIDIILQQKACAPYIAGRLWSFFVYENPEPDLMASLGTLLKESKWDLRPVLQAMLTSKAFYGSRAVGTQIKSPVQLVVGTIRLLDVEMPDARRLSGALDQMGQMPLMPPNVKGWPGGRNWINTSTLFVRYNTALFLAGGAGPVTGGKLKRAGISRDKNPRAKDPLAIARGGSAEQIVDEWVSRLIQRPISLSKRQTLVETLASRTDDQNAVRSMIQLIVSMPEYQLC